MTPIYPIEATVLQNITDWFAIFISTFFIGLVIVDYFAWCIRCSKQLKKNRQARFQMMSAWFSQFLAPILFGFISFFLLRYFICLAAKVVRSTIAAIPWGSGD